MKTRDTVVHTTLIVHYNIDLIIDMIIYVIIDVKIDLIIDVIIYVILDVITDVIFDSCHYTPIGFSSQVWSLSGTCANIPTHGSRVCNITQCEANLSFSDNIFFCRL